MQLDFGPTSIVLAGTRKAPDHAAVSAVSELTLRLRDWRPAIETALFEHYEPYSDAMGDGGVTETNVSFPSITSPADVWRHVSLEFISVSPSSGSLTIELGYTTAWDEEHTLGVRFAGDRLIELCGSVLPP